MNYWSIFVVLYATVGPILGLEYPLEVEEIKFDGGVFRDFRSGNARISPAQNNDAQDIKVFEYCPKNRETGEYNHVFDFEITSMYAMVADVIYAVSFVPTIDPQSHKVHIKFKTREQAREFRFLEIFPTMVTYKRVQRLQMLPSSSSNPPQIDDFHYKLSAVLVFRDGVKKLYENAMLDSLLVSNEKKSNINYHQFYVHREDDEDAQESELIFTTGKFGVGIWPNVRDRTVISIKTRKRRSVSVCLVFANADDGEKFQEQIQKHNDKTIFPNEQEETSLFIANLDTVKDIDSDSQEDEDNTRSDSQETNETAEG